MSFVFYHIKGDQNGPDNIVMVNNEVYGIQAPPQPEHVEATVYSNNTPDEYKNVIKNDVYYNEM